MKSIASVFVFVFVSSIALATPTLEETAKALRYNVVAVNVDMANGKNKQGFGWVVAESEGYLYFVTAAHVVESDNPGEKVERIMVRFFNDDNDAYPVELIPGKSMKLDLAVLRMDAPERRPWMYASSTKIPEDQEKYCAKHDIQKNQPVTYIGAGAEWSIGEDIGKLTLPDSDQTDYDLLAVGLSLDSGSSGAPLISKSGIVGMIVTNSEDGAGVVSLSKIKCVFTEKRQIPWNLIELSKTPKTLVGKWAPKTPNIPDNIRLKFKKSDDYAHYTYTIDYPASPRNNGGIAVVDGDEVRIWQSLTSAKDSWGIFTAHTATPNPQDTIVMDGIIADGNIGPTQLRLAKQRNNFDDPRALAWMGSNPTQFENNFKKWLPAINSTGDGEEAIVALGKEEQLTVLGGMAQGMMLRAGIMRLAEMRLTSVDLEIKNGCYIATGTVPSESKKNDVTELLKSLAKDASDQLGRTYKTCNETNIRGAAPEQSASSDFDFEAELIEARQLLSMMARSANLSVIGECLQLDGKLPSHSHKSLLGNMLKQLASDLNKKLGSKLKACNNAHG